jgi:excisionase family DNA binding protein
MFKIAPDKPGDEGIVPINSVYMSRREAARYLGVAEQTLAVWACNKRYGLPCYKVGRLVKYKKEDLDAFVASRRYRLW